MDNRRGTVAGPFGNSFFPLVASALELRNGISSFNILLNRILELSLFVFAESLDVDQKVYYEPKLHTVDAATYHCKVIIADKNSQGTVQHYLRVEDFHYGNYAIEVDPGFDFD